MGQRYSETTVFARRQFEYDRCPSEYLSSVFYDIYFLELYRKSQEHMPFENFHFHEFTAFSQKRDKDLIPVKSINFFMTKILRVFYISHKIKTFLVFLKTVIACYQSNKLKKDGFGWF